MKTEEKLRSKIFSTEMEFDLTVDYSKSLDEMIKDGHYEYGDNSINSTNFPVIKPFGLNDNIVCVKVKILQFQGYCYNFTDEIKSIYKKGYRPANLAELLAFGKSHPLFQYQEQISCIGSIWHKKYKYLQWLLGPDDPGKSDIIVSLGTNGLDRVLKTHALSQNYFNSSKKRYFLAIIK